MTLIQALVRNVGTCRPNAKGEAQAERIRKGESTDAGHRGGVACSRVESSVMELDRRGERMKHYEEAVLLFAKESQVSFTNNRAERDLRMSKVKQKVSGCFRTSQYAEAYCRISSYLQTMANQGYNPLVAIQLALSGQIYADRGK